MMKKILMIFFASLACLAAVAAGPVSPEEMPNVQVTDRSQYVSDPAGLLSAETRSIVNRRLSDLRKKTSAEVVVALPPDIGDDETIQEWSVRLFSLWKIGKSDKDNGALLVIAPEQRSAFITTGYGMEGVLTDIACAEIIRKTVIPNMKENDINAAVDEATALMATAISDPAVAGELRSAEPDNVGGQVKAIDSEAFWMLGYFVVGVVFLFGLVLLISDFRTIRRYDRYGKARYWHRRMSVYIAIALLSAGAGLIFLLIAFIAYRRNRLGRSARRRTTSFSPTRRTLRRGSRPSTTMFGNVPNAVLSRGSHSGPTRRNTPNAPTATQWHTDWRRTIFSFRQPRATRA